MSPPHSQALITTRAAPGLLRRLFALAQSVLRAPHPLPLADGLSDDDNARFASAADQGIWDDLQSQGGWLLADVKVALDVLHTLRNNGLIDDRGYLVERVIKLASSLPERSANQVRITGRLIRSLWNILPHPPLEYIGSGYTDGFTEESQEAKEAAEVIPLKYRSADGRNYNVLLPNLGRAGTAYARSVPAKTAPPAVWPDAGLMFDTMFARGDKTIEHPTKTSSMLFYLAIIIIHDAFKTAPTSLSKSDTSSYLDLAPLYGNNVEEQKLVRAGSDGKLKPDCFSEPRILGFPPGTSAFLICFNRFHNYVATMLAAINEKGRFTMPAPLPAGREHTHEEERAYATALNKRDEDLFQTARLVTCGLYVNIILNDYVKNILNFNRTELTWTLDPRGDYGHLHDESTAIPSGGGNQVSAEFNLIYRWHACVSDRDAKWTEEFFHEQLHVDNPETLTPDELSKLMKQWGHSIPTDPSQRTFGGLERQADQGGRFKDAELIELLTKSTEDVAGSFGPKNIPKVLRAIEIMGIQQARSWGVATLNEFRQFCGLVPHETFEHINPDPEIARALSLFYKDPDSVELYPGILAEDAKVPMVPGSGLCASFTISKAILSDAVALVRSDRFYTKDYTPANLTNWGIAAVASNPKVVQGRVIYKLFQHAFPGWYRGDSVYAMYPFTVPEETREVLKGFGTDGDYTFDRPSPEPALTPVMSNASVKEVLGDQARFHVPWGPHITQMTGQDFILADDKPANKKMRDDMLKNLFSPADGINQIAEFYEDAMTQLLQDKSYRLGNFCEVDAVRDVANLVHARFASELFGLPLNTPAEPHASAFNERELYKIAAALFTWVFLDADPAASFQLRQTTRTATSSLTSVLEPICSALKDGDLAVGLKDVLVKDNGPMKAYGRHMLQRILQGKTVEYALGQIIPMIAASVANQAQGFAQVLELYLSEPYSQHWPTIQALARDTSDPAGAFAQLRKYAFEGSRLAPAPGIVRTVSADSAVLADGHEVHRGQRLFLSFVAAGLDESAFPQPREIDPTRPEKNYVQYGWGPHSCIGAEIAVTALAVMLKVFGKLDGLRIVAPGIKSVPLRGRVFLSEKWDALSPFPTSMKLRWDAPAEN